MNYNVSDTDVFFLSPFSLFSYFCYQTYSHYRYNVIDGTLNKLRYIRFYVIPV